MQGSLKRLVVPNKAKLIEFDNDNMKSSSRQGPQRQRKIPQLQMKRTMTENYSFGKDLRPLTEESRPQITLPTPKSREIHDFDFFSPRGIKTPLSTTNRISTAGPLLPLEKGNQSYRQKFRKIFQKTQLDSSRENVHVSQFLFSFKNLDKLPSSDRVELELGNDLLDNKKNKVSTASTSGRPYTTLTTQTNALRSTKTTIESEYGFPFKSTLEVPNSKSTKTLLREIRNAELNFFGIEFENNRSKKKKLIRIDSFERNEFASSISSVSDILNYDSPKIAKCFQIKKNVTAKYKSDIRSKEEKKKFLSIQKLSNEEIILQNKNKLLVCVDIEDEDKNQVQYCFVSREIEREHGKKLGSVNLEFNIKLDEIVKKLRLKSVYKYLYLLNGSPVFELSQIPLTENVLIISKQIELNTIEHVIHNELVRDFYEYGTQKDISIYSKSHIGSRMASIMQTKKMIEDKYNNVLQIFNNDDQLESDQLERILEASKSMKKTDLTDTISKVFNRKRVSKMAPINTLIEHPNNSRNSLKYETYDQLKSNLSQIDNILTERLDNEMSQSGDGEERIQRYLEDPRPISENDKLTLYKKICHAYKEGLKEIEFEPEERDDNNALQNIGEDRNDQELERLSKFGNIGEKLGVLLKRWQKSQKKLDYLEIKKTLERLERGELSQNSRLTVLEDLEINQLDENLFEAPKVREEKSARNYIRENIKALNKNKNDIERLHKFNKELFLKNIPKNIQERNLSRRELHSIYILYKALCEITSQRHKEYNLDDGIDFHSFKNGIYQVFLQSDEVAEKIFYNIDINFSGFLNWDEFVNAMVAIRAKTMRDKIDLFIKIADEDGNGNLSWEEVFNLAKICLQKYVTSEGDTFLDDLCEYFTRLIFSSVNISIDEEIPLQAIKDAIISGNEESDLLAMFCGADI